MTTAVQAGLAVVSPALAVASASVTPAHIARSLAGAQDVHAVARALGPLSIPDREAVAMGMVLHGAQPALVHGALQLAARHGAMGDLSPEEYSTYVAVGVALSLAGTAAGAYHGYARNHSVGWALWWALMGGMFPIITVAIAAAQGFGEPARS